MTVRAPSRFPRLLLVVFYFFFTFYGVRAVGHIGVQGPKGKQEIRAEMPGEKKERARSSAASADG